MPWFRTQRFAVRDLDRGHAPVGRDHPVRIDVDEDVAAMVVVEAIVLGGRRELDVLADQIPDSAELAAGVVSRWRTVTVKITAQDAVFP